MPHIGLTELACIVVPLVLIVIGWAVYRRVIATPTRRDETKKRDG